MNDQTPKAADASNLQFDEAEFTEPTATDTTCVVCRQTIPDHYFQVNGAVLCESCSTAVKEHLSGGSGSRRFLKACLFGFGAAIAGFAIYFGVLKITGMEIGLISILVGYMVGTAVRKGSDGRGGVLYQLTAVFFTYLAIAVSYSALVIPQMINDFKAKKAGAAAQPKNAATADKKAAPAEKNKAEKSKAVQNDPDDEIAAREPLTPVDLAFGVAILLGFLLSLPVIAGFSQPIGLLIIAFALWEAFKLNRKAELVITGPHSVGPTPDRALAHV